MVSYEGSYVFPYPSPSLMVMPKLHEVDFVQFGMSHARTFSSIAGHEERTRYCAENRFSVTYLWECTTSKLYNDILTFHHEGVMGHTFEFWMPMWVEEFKCVNGITAGSNTVIVYPNSLASIFPNWMMDDLQWNAQALFIRTRNGDQYVRPIKGCPTDSILLLDTAFPHSIAYEDILIASRVRRWVFASGINETWVSSVNLRDDGNRVVELSASFEIVSCPDDSDGNGVISPYEEEDHHIVW